jgi:hypothetical protein
MYRIITCKIVYNTYYQISIVMNNFSKIPRFVITVILVQLRLYPNVENFLDFKFYR